jgi:glycosyltransferase involved in cell wall biosynthesis
LRFKVVIPSYNSARWIGRTLRSVARQRDEAYEVCVIDDASTDPRQREIIAAWCEREGWEAIYHEENRGALASIVEGIARLGPEDEDVIVTVDGDDWLYGRGALPRLRQIFGEGGVTLTYGQYVTYGRYLGTWLGDVGPSRAFPPEVVEEARYRELPWAFSHLRAFKHLLWRQIRDEDLRGPSGEYFRTAWDLAMMFPMAEMAGQKIRFVPDILYVYNRATPHNDDKLRLEEQKRTAEYIRTLPRYPRIVEGTPRPVPDRLRTGNGTDWIHTRARWAQRVMRLRRKLGI